MIPVKSVFNIQKIFQEHLTMSSFLSVSLTLIIWRIFRRIFDLLSYNHIYDLTAWLWDLLVLEDRLNEMSIFKHFSYQWGGNQFGHGHLLLERKKVHKDGSLNIIFVWLHINSQPTKWRKGRKQTFNGGSCQR